jgi:16S rRNA (uracil1498-N3)-methyltransferase
MLKFLDMKIHRFIDNFNLSQKELEINGEIAHQIIKVLKLKIGEKIELSDGKNISAIAEILEISDSTSLTTSKNSVIVKLGTLLRSASFAGQNNTKQVHLFCAVLKKENFELVVQKATECGINKIIPIITERTIKTGLNLERLKKISKEASEQSGRIDIPEISEPIKFKNALDLAEGKDNFFLDFTGKTLSKKSFSSANIWIGPEGGWTQKELNLAKENNFQIISLGSLTLRAETAAIIGTYLIVNS